MKRFIAHITIEAKTPLKVGSNKSDFLQDSPVQKDWNNLPMILGTSLSGVLRKEFSEDEADKIFGKDEGSKVIFSNALLCDENGNVCEALGFDSEFLDNFLNLPLRDHTAINTKGVVKEHSKFDEEVVYKGARFRFSMEVLEEKEILDAILEKLSLDSLRFGGGSSKGFGEFEVVEITTKEFDKNSYIAYNPSLNTKLDPFTLQKQKDARYTKYTLKLTPEDFFIFGSGFGDDDADNTPVYEKIITWKNGKGVFSEEQILIPSSSIKGAISHRVAYHYNKSQKIYIDKILKDIENEKKRKEIIERYTGENNEAVKAIFGYKKETIKENGENKELGQKGKVLLSDCFKPKAKEKVFDHVAIDRFTGGAIDGALFQEKTIADDREYTIEILLKEGIDKVVLEAFEKTLNDICSGMLPLGGAVTKGHGVFCGRVLKNGVEL